MARFKVVERQMVEVVRAFEVDADSQEAAVGEVESRVGRSEFLDSSGPSKHPGDTTYEVMELPADRLLNGGILLAEGSIESDAVRGPVRIWCEPEFYCPDIHVSYRKARVYEGGGFDHPCEDKQFGREVLRLLVEAGKLEAPASQYTIERAEWGMQGQRTATFEWIGKTMQLTGARTGEVRTGEVEVGRAMVMRAGATYLGDE